MIKRKMILAQVKRLPPLPAAIPEAMNLMRDPQVDMGRLARVLQFDPAITANILRLANSSYFGAVHNITTLRDAVVRLGARRVAQLVLTVAVAPKISTDVKGYDLPPKALLEHSLAIAVASELVAAEIRVEPPSHTFTAGLLANIGKTVLGQFLEIDAEDILTLAETEGLSFEEAERRVLGVDHLEVGAELLRAWNLPEEIVEVVQYRLAPEDCPSKNPALDLVHAGDAIARMTGIGQGLDGMQYRVSEAVVNRLGISPEGMETVMGLLPEHVAKLQAILANVKK